MEGGGGACRRGGGEGGAVEWGGWKRRVTLEQCWGLLAVTTKVTTTGGAEGRGRGVVVGSGVARWGATLGGVPSTTPAGGGTGGSRRGR